MPLPDRLEDKGNQLLTRRTLQVRHRREDDPLRRPQIEKRTRARLSTIILDALGTQRGRLADEPPEPVKLQRLAVGGALPSPLSSRVESDTNCPSWSAIANRTDTDRPVGLDLLDAKTEREQDLAVQFLIGLFEELFLPDHQGPVLHQALANAMRLAMETGGTLPELPVLLSDNDLARGRLVRCENPWVRHWFEHVWFEIKGSSRGESLAYFTSKLARFLDDSMLRNILGQKNAPDLGAHFENGGVMLARLARGPVGEFAAQLLGRILLHKVERLMLARSEQAQEARPPFHVYVDEFQEMGAASTLVRILRAARKFNVGLTLASQELRVGGFRGGFSEALVEAAGHFVFFRLGGHGSSDYADLLFPRFYDRDLETLANYQALARVTRSDGKVGIGRSAVPEPDPGTPEAARSVRVWSRRRFGRARKAVEREILNRLEWS